MQISDEMIEAAWRAYALAGPLKDRMRAALEAALGQKQGKKYSAADNLRNWAKAKATEDNEYLRADLLSNAACIEDLAAALKEVLIGGNHLALLIRHGHPSANATPRDAACHYGPDIPAYDAWCCWSSIMRARAALEKWGLK